MNDKAALFAVVQSHLHLSIQALILESNSMPETKVICWGKVTFDITI